MSVMADNIKKVAVTMEGEQAQFIELDQGQPLAAVIKDLCDRWSLTNPDDYALQFNMSRHDFITERNRTEIQKGFILHLTFSPAKTAADILEKLGAGGAGEQQAALRQLAELANDATFAQEFIGKNGLPQVVAMIESNQLSGEPLSYTLKAFVELMDHGIVSWDVLEAKFIKIVAGMTATVKGGAMLTSTLQYALEILESVVMHSSDKYKMVEQEITPVSLVQHLECANADIQKNAIALINAIFLRADPEKKRKITDKLTIKSIRNVILNYVIRSSQSISVEMAHQLYVLQSLMFSLLDDRRMTPVDPNDSQTVTDITDLRKLAFENDPRDAPQQQLMSKRQSHAEDYKKLGFQNTINPLEDFSTTPPGVLALSNMAYFARQHGEAYAKVVLENSYRADDHDLPFARASIHLTLMLCEVLKVGDMPTDDGELYHPMFFTHNQPFEEFFCACIQLLNKTWKEMRATSADFKKVLSVVRQQILRALSKQPASFDKFRTYLNHLTYAKITDIWQKERRDREEWESQAKPIVELREQIKPEILELIKQQRLGCLVAGTRFLKPNTKRKDKFWYCRLSPNHKVFHYGDCEEGANPSFDQLSNKVAVADIRGLLLGKECPHIKDKGKKSSSAGLAFSIMSEAEGTENLNFIAPSEQEFNMWTDGINALMGSAMSSQQSREDLETLLSMEIKLRLLDTEGLDIPNSPPPIPKEPPNYNFAYGSM